MYERRKEHDGNVCIVLIPMSMLSHYFTQLCGLW